MMTYDDLEHLGSLKPLRSVPGNGFLCNGTTTAEELAVNLSDTPCVWGSRGLLQLRSHKKDALQVLENSPKNHVETPVISSYLNISQHFSR